MNAVATSPLAKAIVGAVTGGGMELYQQIKAGQGINWAQVGISTAGGALSGLISGKIVKKPSCNTKSQSIGGMLNVADIAVNFAEATAYSLTGGQSLGDSLKNGVKSAAIGIATDIVMTSISGVGEKRKCFVAGTQILTAAGLVSIETVKAGDIVIATDPETGETAEKEVVETYVRESDELVHVWVNGEEIVTTPTHPFYVPEKGWTDAIDLRAGDILVLVNGEYVVVEKVQHEITEEPVTVYNFQVADFHTYYVSEQSVLVHNSEGYSESAESTRKKQLENNKKQGRDYEAEQLLVEQTSRPNTVEQVTILTNDGTKIRVDAIGSDDNGITITEFKSSQTAPLTPNQAKGFPELYQNGGVVVGKGKGAFPGGTVIPAGTRVIVRRKK